MLHDSKNDQVTPPLSFFSCLLELIQRQKVHPDQKRLHWLEGEMLDRDYFLSQVCCGTIVLQFGDGILECFILDDRCIRPQIESKRFSINPAGMSRLFKHFWINQPLFLLRKTLESLPLPAPDLPALLPLPLLPPW
jgi:hypothetical protein